jgi:hypothetical protein
VSLSYKQRYMDKWRVSMLRELYVYDYLNWLMVSHGYILKYVGLGAGSSEYIRRYYNSPEEALDFAIYTFSGKLIGFLDVTGYANPRLAKGDSKRCVGSWKLWKAEQINKELGIPLHRIWFAHFTDSHHILVFINAERLQQLINMGKAEKRRLYEDEKPSYCLDLKYWIPPSRFIQLLSQGVRK